MKRELLHHRLDLQDIKSLARCDIEVWDDTPRDGQPPHVSLNWHGEMSSIDLRPNEARALAALLIVAADGQDRAAEATP